MSKKSMLDIHDAVDFELVEVIHNAMRGHKETQLVGAVLGALAIVLAEAIATSAVSDDKVCLIADRYGEYVHQTAHFLFEKLEPGQQKH